MIDYEYINILSRLTPLINMELLDPVYTENNSPISLNIVHRSSMYNKLALFLMLKTLLRFSDLHNFKLKDAVDCEYFNIKQNKTDKVVSINFNICNENLKILLSSILNVSKFLNYESLRSELRWITPPAIQKQLTGHNSSTHLFRHLESSFANSKGLSPKRIANKLGHYDLGSQKNYIHNFPIILFPNTI